MLPYGISEVRDSDGKIVYRRSGSGPGPVVAPELVGLMNDMLTGVVTFGTGKSAALGRPAAGKTGTTQEYRDAWFIGYTPDLVAGVWLGNDDNTPMNKITGGSLPAAAWRNFMLSATKGNSARPLPSAPPPAPAAPAEESAMDKLLGWLGIGDSGEANALPVDPGRYPGPAIRN